MAEKFEIQIEIKKVDLSICLSYIKDDLTMDGIRSGFWCKEEIRLEQVMSPFFKEDEGHLICEGLGYWVNDDFDEIIPYCLVRDITEYGSDILIDPLTKTEIIFKINHVASES